MDIVNAYILTFDSLSKEELEAKLQECNKRLMSMEKIENLADTMDQIEALKFLLQNCDSNE